MHAESFLGQQLGDYLVTDLIGRGGMGVVFRALKGDMPVALKVMAPELARDDELRERFIRETEVQIDHPNIVPIYEAGMIDGHLYLTMKLIDGHDLKDTIRRERRLGPSRILHIFGQAAEAIDAAHENGIVHRDVKPQNFLLEPVSDNTEHLYLSDFGLIKSVASQTSITASAHLVGTAHYMSPEQIKNKGVDGRSDVYSLGCVLFECLTGKVPYNATEEVAVLFSHVHDDIPRVTEDVLSLPSTLDSVVAKAMAKDPSDRYLTAGDLSCDLANALSLPQSWKRTWSLPDISLDAPAIAPEPVPALPEANRTGGRAGWLVAAASIAVAAIALVSAPRDTRDRALSFLSGDRPQVVASKTPTEGRRDTGNRQRAKNSKPTGKARSREDEIPLVALASGKQPDPSTSTPPTPSSRSWPRPTSGTYTYSQVGHEAVCARNGDCTDNGDLSGEFKLEVMDSSPSAPNGYVASGPISNNLGIAQLLQTRKTRVTLDETVFSFTTSDGNFTVRLDPDPGAELLRFPLERGSDWRGAWTSEPIGGNYSVVVEGTDRTKVADRRISTVRIKTVLRWSGEHSGELKTTSWVDPRTRLVIESVSFISALTGTDDRSYEASFQRILSSGPGYR